MPVEDTGLFREWQRREPEELLGTVRGGLGKIRRISVELPRWRYAAPGLAR